MPEWNSDRELLQLIRAELFTAVVGDVCDDINLRGRFLPPNIKPLGGRISTVLAGRAMPVLEQDVESEPADGSQFGLMLQALDSLQPDEIYVSVGATKPYALFGELMSIAAMKCGAAGVVCDGNVRDTEKILELGFPVFCRGSYSLDQRGRGMVVDFRGPVQLGEVRISSGDFLIGDTDGVISIPAEAAEEVFSLALEKARKENGVKAALEQGVSATQAFHCFGVF
jgi:regulator of RNase E activity RraA